MIQHFIIEGKWLGQSERSAQFIHGELRDPLSLLFYCECCGSAYAQCPVVLASGKTSIWLSIRRCCPRCQPNFFTAPAGSIWLSYDDAFTLAFPPAVLEREFLLHLNHYSKDQI